MALMKLKYLVEEFLKIDLGYPKGEHRIREQGNPRGAAEMCKILGVASNGSFEKFYEYCDGIDLPDVGNGYYVLSLSDIVSVNGMNSEPNRFNNKDIVMFGTDGGGGRFVITKDSNEIYYLPTAEVTASRDYRGHQVKLEVSGMEGFVQYLRDRVEEQ
jgi:hypothetical protein